jgi:hypothetical protein
MAAITIRPERLRQFGDPTGSVFCLVTNSDLLPLVTVEGSGGYADYATFAFDPGDVFVDVLETLPRRAHVLVVSPGCFFESPPPHLLGERKLMGMACNSTATTADTIAHFLDVMERTDPAEQEEVSDRFFAIAEDAEYLEYVNEEHGTSLRFDHFSADYEWNQQAGLLGWGEQQIVPAGELSVLPVQILSFDESLRLALNGELTLHGYPILHNGRPSFTRADQSRVHGELAAMTDHAIVATVRDGTITALRGTSAAAAPAIEMLDAMFRVDSRYRLVWEIGHAINTSLVILAGNHAMNEVYGGTEGAVHWGLGLTPYTQYHLDVICPGTVVRADDGRVLLGTGARAAVPA